MGSGVVGGVERLQRIWGGILGIAEEMIPQW